MKFHTRLTSLVIGSILFALIFSACKSTPSASLSSIALGGRLYDHWMKTIRSGNPEGNSPLWASQTSNTRNGTDTWRCKECHGWDYRGEDGAYGSGSHYTGFPGLYQASVNKSKAQLLNALSGGPEPRHDFTSVISQEDHENLVEFLKNGVFDFTKYIEYTTKKPIQADSEHGQELFSGICANCHGPDGKKILFDSMETLGFLAKDNPWEVVHKIRCGQPDSHMPSGIVSGWSIQDAVDVLSYTQSLPE